jgi:prepilin-type N-terminal cleavage/methylation domain-containing protein
MGGLLAMRHMISNATLAPQVLACGALRVARRGFSLIELVIVMVIVGVAGAVAIPRLTSQSASNQTFASISQLSASMKQQRERAVALGSVQQLRFASDGYLLVERDAAGVKLRKVPLRGAQFVAVEFGGSDQAGICFGVNGSGCIGGSVVVGTGNQLARVDFDGVTGLARYVTSDESLDSFFEQSSTTPIVLAVDKLVVPKDADPRRLLLLEDLAANVEAELSKSGVVAHVH